MPDRSIKFNILVRILASYGLEVGAAKGQGARGSEAKVVGKHMVTGEHRIHVLGKHGRNPEVLRQQVANLRRKFGLKADDGVTDEDFYGRA